jgi:hypothetical protein
MAIRRLPSETCFWRKNSRMSRFRVLRASQRSFNCTIKTHEPSVSAGRLEVPWVGPNADRAPIRPEVSRDHQSGLRQMTASHSRGSQERTAPRNVWVDDQEPIENEHEERL